jgi:hypothetical protein
MYSSFLKAWGKRLLRTPGSRWEVNIQMYLREIQQEGIDCGNQAMDRAKWLAVVYMVMNLWFSQYAGKFFSSWDLLASKKGGGGLCSMASFPVEQWLAFSKQRPHRSCWDALISTRAVLQLQSATWKRLKFGNNTGHACERKASAQNYGTYRTSLKLIWNFCGESWVPAIFFRFDLNNCNFHRKIEMKIFSPKKRAFVSWKWM